MSNFSSAVVYHMSEKYYTIDRAKKTAAISEWEGSGDGFQLGRESDKNRRRVRYDGKEIGQIQGRFFTARTAPGHLAVQLDNEPKQRLTVWTAATADRVLFDFAMDYSTPIVGWIK